jgi:hypothetical protein
VVKLIRIYRTNLTGSRLITKNIFMKKIIQKIKNVRTLRRQVLVTIASALAVPIIVLAAALNNLNGVTTSAQNFVNDANISIVSSSSASTHTIKWNGHLPISRGGTGNGSFTTGSILFASGASISEDNTFLFWDDINKLLGIGTNSPQERLDVGNGSIKANTIKTIDIEIEDSAVGNDWLISGTTGLHPNVPEGGLAFQSGGSGKNVIFEDQDNQGVPSLYVKGIGSGGIIGVLTFSPDFEIDVVGDIHATGGFILGASTSYDIKSSSSTLFIGSPTKSGCIALGDSDGSGLTYIWANDGVLLASSSKPAFCQ